VVRKRLDERDTRLIVIAAACVAAGLFYALRARGPVRLGSAHALAVLCERLDAPRRDWRMIVVHHSASSAGNAASFDRYHRNDRGWDSLAYHFVIGNGRGAPDGQIEAGPRWRGQQPGAHAGSSEVNNVGIGICLVGDFEKGQPTPAQMQSLVRLVRYLQQRYGIKADKVLMHRDVHATECPGKLFPEAAFRQALH